MDETEALIEETLDDTDACLEETEGLGPTLEETDMAELWLVLIVEEVTEELVMELRVDDAVMVWFMPTLFLVSSEHGYETATTYIGALMG